MSPDKLVYMANQIGQFFASQGADRAAAAIAEHISKFWDPRMRSAIIAYAKEDGGDLSPNVLRAVKDLKEVSASE
jgi:formate dehydrogenase subunit delta